MLILNLQFTSFHFCCCSASKSCPTLWPHDCSTPNSPIFWSVLKFMSVEWVCYLIISSSPVPFSFFPQSFPVSGAFPVSWLIASGGQNIGASTSACVLPMNIQHSFRIDWFDLLAVQGALKSLLQHHNLKAAILQHSAFLMVQLSYPYMTTGKTIALPRRAFVSKAMAF